MTLVRLTISLFTAAVLLTGCGESDDTGNTAVDSTLTADSTPTVGESATPSPSSTTLTPDELEVASVGETYLQAMASGDSKSACATRAAIDVRQASSLYGTCKAAFDALFKSEGQETMKALLRDAVITEVSIQGNRAAAAVSHPGQDKFMTLLTVREGGNWKLVDVPDAEADDFLNSGN